MRWPHAWHDFRYHPHIHWSILTIFSFVMAKIITLALVTATVILPFEQAFAASKTWTSQSDFEGTSISTGKWTRSDTSTTVNPGSITLGTQSSSWSNISSRLSGIDGNVVDLVKQSNDSNNKKFWLLTFNSTNSIGQIWKTTDGGSSWSMPGTYQTSVLYGIWAVDDNTIVLVGHDGVDIGVWRSTNGGQSFQDVHNGITAVVDVQGVGSTLYATYVKSTNSGANWNTYGEISGGSSYFVADANTAKEVSSNTINGTTNGGSSWTREELITGAAFNQIVSPDNTNWFAIYSLSSSFGVHKKAGSNDWESAYTGSEFANEPYLTISMVSSTSGRIAGSDGKIYKTTNNFGSISAETSGTGETIRQIVCVSMESCLAGADNATVLQYTSTYKTSGTSTVQFQPQSGTTQDWQSATVTTTLNGQTVTTQYSYDNSSWKNSISDVPNSETLYVRFSLSTNDTSKTPSIDAVTVNYATASSGGSGSSGGSDTTAPTISNLSATTTKTGATIKWTTNESATHTIYYGTKSGNLNNTQSAGSGTSAQGGL